MPVNAGFELHLNPEAKAEIDAAAFSAVQEVFELDIKPEAVRGSPVRRGTNRRSIDTEVTQTPDGKITARIFTQSGYGGYLETGTYKMKAQPYIFPAWEKFKNRIAEIFGRNIGTAGLEVKRK